MYVCVRVLVCMFECVRVCAYVCLFVRACTCLCMRVSVCVCVVFFMHLFSGTKHPREDNPNLYYWAEMTRQHTQTFNI